jgi:hypothetical protein
VQLVFVFNGTDFVRRGVAVLLKLLDLAAVCILRLQDFVCLLELLDFTRHSFLQDQFLVIYLQDLVVCLQDLAVCLFARLGSLSVCRTWQSVCLQDLAVCLSAGLGSLSVCRTWQSVCLSTGLGSLVCRTKQSCLQD